MHRHVVQRRRVSRDQTNTAKLNANRPHRLHIPHGVHLPHSLRHLNPHTWHLHHHERGDQDWWFAGTAVPLLAATIGPLANVLSIAALVTSWRMCLVDNVDPASCPWSGNTSELIAEVVGHPFADPRWCYWINAASLMLGCLGNLFLLFNFTGFVRYIIALPFTIMMWFVATGLLVGITSAVNLHVPPISPQQTYTQGFWYATMAAALYFIAAVMLMFNMLGYFLGHFPQRFELSDSQRTLILQTMMFFIWLAAGAAVFSAVEQKYGVPGPSWSYPNALYFAVVTTLTIGFGDITCKSTIGRGLILPYAIGGIIMLGLVITSISRIAHELGSDKVINKHQERSRAHTAERVVASVEELSERLKTRFADDYQGKKPVISAPIEAINQSAKLRIIEPLPHKPGVGSILTKKGAQHHSEFTLFRAPTLDTLSPITMRSPMSFKSPISIRKRPPRILLLERERDRFNEMRRIEEKTTKWKRWTALVMSLMAFALVWLLGALVFFYAEASTQGLSYFDALYLCYVSLLSIGYGDMAPQSNIGRPFFVVWSLIAVPTMTILVGAMGDTVISGFKRGTERFAEVTILPRIGIMGEIMAKVDRTTKTIHARREANKAQARLEDGFPVGFDGEGAKPASPAGSFPSATVQDDADSEKDRKPAAPDLQALAKEADDEDHGKPPSDMELAKRLSAAIQRVSVDLRCHPPRRYVYEEWVEFTKLIRFTDYKKTSDLLLRRRPASGRPALRRTATGATTAGGGDVDEQLEDLIEWDWIGKDSPMMAQSTEAEFVMDRLCESMLRYLRNLEAGQNRAAADTGEGPPQAGGAAVAIDDGAVEDGGGERVEEEEEEEEEEDNNDEEVSEVDTKVDVEDGGVTDRVDGASNSAPTLANDSTHQQD